MSWKTLLIALALAAPSFAQSRPAAVYPIAGDGGVTPLETKDLEGTLQSALVRMLRSGPFEPANPPMVSAKCGPARGPDLACLAKAAGNGVVLYGVAKKVGPYLTLSLSAVDGRKAVAGPVTVRVDPAIDNPQIFVSALQRLAAPPPPPRTATPAPAPAPGTPPSPAPAPAAAPKPKAPAAAVAAEGPPSSEKWIGRTALITGGGAVLALGGGLLFGYLASKSSDDLTAKYNAHTLQPADASAYPGVQQKTHLANGLFIASGVLAVAALTFWALMPDDAPGGSY